MVKTNYRNKILTEEEIQIKAKEKMDQLLKQFPPVMRTDLILFHNEANKIDSWICDKYRQMLRSKKK